MGTYEPKFLYADAITGTTSATVTAGQTLVVSGNGTVAPAGATAANFIGVATCDAASGAKVSYNPRGKVHVSVASGGITAGAQLATGAAGTVASLAAAAAAATGDVNNARAVIGIALTTALDTANVEWMEV